MPSSLNVMSEPLCWSLGIFWRGLYLTFWLREGKPSCSRLGSLQPGPRWDNVVRSQVACRAADDLAVEPTYVVAADLAVVVAVEPVAGEIGHGARPPAADRELVRDVRVE